MELPNRSQLETAFARDLGKLSEKHKQELVRLLGNPPNPKNVPPEFWQEVEDDDREKLAFLLLLIFFSSATAHGMSDAQAHVEATSWAADHASQLAAQLTRTSRETLNRLGAEWEQRTRDGETIPRGEVRDACEAIYGPTRVARIVDTEYPTAQAAGTEAGIHGRDPTGLQILLFWRHSEHRPRKHCNSPIEPCETCSPLEGLTSSQCGGNVPGVIHPNCDCFWEAFDLASGEWVGYGPNPPADLLAWVEEYVRHPAVLKAMAAAVV